MRGLRQADRAGLGWKSPQMALNSAAPFAVVADKPALVPAGKVNEA
jgi:hypothetical protein